MMMKSAFALLLACLIISPAAAQLRVLKTSPDRDNPLADPVIANEYEADSPVGVRSLRKDRASQTPASRPQPGQPGKDVLWLPTPDALVQDMLRAAAVSRQDHVVDLGSGDGRIAIAAARDFGATALGIEYEPALVTLARRNAIHAGVADKALFVQGDLFRIDFSDASVVTLYLRPGVNRRLLSRLLALRPGTRILSNAFPIGNWPPEQTIRSSHGIAYLWTVPAQVTGHWAFEAGEDRFTVHIRQHFQQLEMDNSPHLIGGALRGTAIRLQQSNGAMLEGEVGTNEMTGPGWIASRIPDSR